MKRVLLLFVLLLTPVMVLAFTFNSRPTLTIDGSVVNTWNGTAVFPLRGVLDNFNRADADALGSNWSPGYAGVLGVFGISGNQMDVYSQVGNYTQAYWNASTFGPNVETHITVAHWGTTARVNFNLKLINPDSTNASDGYGVTFYANGTYALKRVDDAASIIISGPTALAQSVADGDSYAASYHHGTIYAWHKPVGGSWYVAGQIADTTYQNQVGYIVFYVYGGTDGLFEDFGGGTIP